MKDKFISRRYWKSKLTAMGASDELSKSFNDVINLSLGDPDLITPDIIIEGAFKDAKLGHTKYTDFRGDPELRSEISKYYKDQYGMDVADNEIMVTTSGNIAMYLTMEAVLDDGDEVITPDPCFTPYPQQIELARGVRVALPCYESEGFQFDIGRLRELITERTKAILINTPANPTGAVLSRETLEKIAQVAIENDLLVIADDIYTLFSFSGKFIPIASLPGMRERTVTINSFSKDFLMTGWRIGNIVAPANIIETIRMINENVAFTSPSISQRAAIYALRNRKDIQPELYDIYKDRVFYAAERINALKNISVPTPQGTFYLFPNISKTGLTSQQVADAILKEAHVLALPGDAFGTHGEGHIRIACTKSVEVLKEAFDRIAKMDIFK